VKTLTLKSRESRALRSQVRNLGYLFASPSLAAGVMLGRPANGRVEWKAADGRTLKDIQDAATVG